MAVDTPMPSASDATAKSVKAGASLSRRGANRTSARICSIAGSLRSEPDRDGAAEPRGRRAPIGSRGTHGYNSTHPHAQAGETLRDRRTRDRVRVLGREPPAGLEVLPEARHPRLRRHGPAPAREMD